MLRVNKIYLIFIFIFCILAKVSAQDSFSPSVFSNMSTKFMDENNWSCNAVSKEAYSKLRNDFESYQNHFHKCLEMFRTEMSQNILNNNGSEFVTNMNGAPPANIDPYVTENLIKLCYEEKVKKENNEETSYPDISSNGLLVKCEMLNRELLKVSQQIFSTLSADNFYSNKDKVILGCKGIYGAIPEVIEKNAGSLASIFVFTQTGDLSSANLAAQVGNFFGQILAVSRNTYNKHRNHYVDYTDRLIMLNSYSDICDYESKKCEGSKNLEENNSLTNEVNCASGNESDDGMDMLENSITEISQILNYTTAFSNLFDYFKFDSAYYNHVIDGKEAFISGEKGKSELIGGEYATSQLESLIRNCLMSSRLVHKDKSFKSKWNRKCGDLIKELYPKGYESIGSGSIITCNLVNQLAADINILIEPDKNDNVQYKLKLNDRAFILNSSAAENGRIEISKE